MIFVIILLRIKTEINDFTGIITFYHLSKFNKIGIFVRVSLSYKLPFASNTMCDNQSLEREPPAKFLSMLAVSRRTGCFFSD